MLHNQQRIKKNCRWIFKNKLFHKADRIGYVFLQQGNQILGGRESGLSGSELVLYTSIGYNIGFNLKELVIIH